MASTQLGEDPPSCSISCTAQPAMSVSSVEFPVVSILSTLGRRGFAISSVDQPVGAKRPQVEGGVFRTPVSGRRPSLRAVRGPSVERYATETVSGRRGPCGHRADSHTGDCPGPRDGTMASRQGYGRGRGALERHRCAVARLRRRAAARNGTTKAAPPDRRARRDRTAGSGSAVSPRPSSPPSCCNSSRRAGSRWTGCVRRFRWAWVPLQPRPAAFRTTVWRRPR